MKGIPVSSVQGWMEDMGCACSAWHCLRVGFGAKHASKGLSCAAGLRADLGKGC